MSGFAGAGLEERTVAALDAATHAPDVLVRCTADGVVAWVSPSVEGMLGRRPEELIGTRWRMTPVGEREPLLEELRRAAGVERDVVRSRRQLLHADGSLVWGDIAARIVRDEHQRVVAVILSIREVPGAVDVTGASCDTCSGPASVLLLMADGPLRRSFEVELATFGSRVTTSSAVTPDSLDVIRGMATDASVVDPRLFRGAVHPLRRIVEAVAPAPVLVVIRDHDEAAFVNALTQGARGVVLRDRPRDAPRAVQAALAGQVVIPRPLAGTLVAALRSSDRINRGEGLLADLTERERQILDLVGQGLSTRQIADELVVAPVTVRSHIAAAMRKLNVHDRAEAVAVTRRLSFVDITDARR